MPGFIKIEDIEHSSCRKRSILEELEEPYDFLKDAVSAAHDVGHGLYHAFPFNCS
jgi:hypothetical protein